MIDNKKLTIFGAGYPEKHPESSSAEDDLMHLKKKVSFLLCFDFNLNSIKILFQGRCWC